MSDIRTGSNTRLPPLDLDALKEWLGDVHGDLATQSAALVADLATLPETITNDDDKAIVVDALAHCARVLKSVKSAREDTKAPFLSAERAVDGFFLKTIAKPITDLRDVAQDELTRYDNVIVAQKREAARKLEAAAAAVERQKAEEARKLAERERRAPYVERTLSSHQVRAESEAHGSFAAQQRQVVNAPAADLTRARTEKGALSTSRTTWDFEVTDPGQVHPRFKGVDPRLIRSAMQEQVRLETIETYREPGIRYFRKTESMVRG